MRPDACLCLLLVAVGLVTRVVAAPPPIASLAHMYAALCAQGLTCDKESGPVCAVDASGLPKNFHNSCHVMLENCVRMTNFAVVKLGDC